MPNVELSRFSRPSMWRKMALVNWRHPADPQVHARLEVEMTQALEYARQESPPAGVRVTPTHLVMRAVALALKKYPEANAIVRWNRVYARKRVHIFCQVAIPGPKPDLSGVILRDADSKTPVQLAQELQPKVRAARRGTDAELARTQQMLDKVPYCINRLVLGLLDFFAYTLNWDLRFLGIPQDPFGGALVSDIGSLGMFEAFAPLSPITRTPIVVAVGKVEDKPVVRGQDVVIAPVCVLCVTFDHRIMDGLLAAKLAKFVSRYLADPAKFEQQEAEKQMNRL